MAQAPALPAGFELPLEARLPRIGAVDAVALEERGGVAREALDQARGEGLGASPGDPHDDLTTLEGADTPGKAAAIASKARRPGSRRSVGASGRRRVRLPESRTRRA